MMADYISREAALKDFESCNAENPNWTPTRVKTLLIRQPAADVAPVVRCKDCKYHYDCGVHFCNRLRMDCPDDSDFFCSYGERKDNDEREL